jgi:hypothetical protein
MANPANEQSITLYDLIKLRQARVDWRQKESKPLDHCAACDPSEILQPRIAEECTSQALLRKQNGLRIMLTEKLLGQESELKTQRHLFSKSRKM